MKDEDIRELMFRGQYKSIVTPNNSIVIPDDFATILHFKYDLWKKEQALLDRGYHNGLGVPCFHTNELSKHRIRLINPLHLDDRVKSKYRRLYAVNMVDIDHQHMISLMDLDWHDHQVDIIGDGLSFIIHAHKP